MNEEKHFLEAINAGEPNADLIYADWLEEQGRPEADEVRDPVIVSFPNWLWLTFRHFNNSRCSSYHGTYYGFCSKCQSTRNNMSWYNKSSSRSSFSLKSRSSCSTWFAD